MHTPVRRALGALAAAAVLSVASATAASAATDPTVTFTPTSGPAGTTVSVQGTCPGADGVMVMIGRQQDDDAMNAADADVAADGSYTTTIKVRTTTSAPAPRAGDHLNVVAVCLVYGQDVPDFAVADATFAVTAGSTAGGGGTSQPGVKGPHLPGTAQSTAASRTPTLPVTGGADWQLGAVGAGLLVLGGGLVLAARRRTTA